MNTDPHTETEFTPLHGTSSAKRLKERGLLSFDGICGMLRPLAQLNQGFLVLQKFLR